MFFVFFALQKILSNSRENATRVIFLITDGYSNGGDPRPVAALLRAQGVEIFTFGIWQGNIRELNDMASHPKEEHCYLLHNFAEFEALARRALHEGEERHHQPPPSQKNSLAVVSLETSCGGVVTPCFVVAVCANIWRPHPFSSSGLYRKTGLPS